MDFVPSTTYSIFQSKHLFSYSVDSVFLTHFASPKGKVADLGCGTGLLSLYAAYQKEVIRVDSVDILPEVINLLEQSIKYNHLEDIVYAYCEDVLDFSESHKNTYDTVLVNPPYFKNSLKKLSPYKALAKQEENRSLEDFIYGASRLLKGGGRGYFVLPAQRLVDGLTWLRTYKLEPKRIQFLSKKQGEPPFIFAVEGLKGGKSFLKIEPSQFLYDKEGRPLDYKNIYGEEGKNV
ncbi:MAG: methyltransferase [Tissierellia bacterium]|nr:methyltransferase [Tissierellia bacterium]